MPKEMWMTRVLIPSCGPSAWRQLLADPEKHWVRGASAFGQLAKVPRTTGPALYLGWVTCEPATDSQVAAVV